jgi:hypothetical protein
VRPGPPPRPEADGERERKREREKEERTFPEQDPPLGSGTVKNAHKPKEGLPSRPNRKDTVVTLHRSILMPLPVDCAWIVLD